MLAKVLIDKTARHFDIDNSILDDSLQHIETGETVIEPEQQEKKQPKDIDPYNED
jgi:hypothetical protein